MKKLFTLDRFTILWFSGLIAAPLLVQMIQPDATSNEVENRNLAPLPPWPATWKELADFPGEFEKYYNDNFGFRSQLNYLYANGLYYGLGVVPFDKVRIREDGWIFEKIVNERNCARFSAEKLDRIAGPLVENARKLKQKGIPYLLVVVPKKSTVYDYRFPSLACAKNETGGFQIQQYLHKRDPGIDVINLHPNLVDAKQQERVYYLMDTHWNETGAFIGYQQIMKHLKRSFPSLTVKNRSEFTEVERSHPPGGLARFANIEVGFQTDVFFEPKTQPKARRMTQPNAKEPGLWEYRRETEIYTNIDKTLPTLMVFHNSYFKQLKKLIAEHFSTATYIWSETLDFANIDLHQPELVIQQITQ